MKLLPEDFPKRSQQMMETFYLKPFGSTEPSPIPPGYIPRKIHGAMHATRVQFWSIVCFEKMKDWFPKYTHGAIYNICQKLGIDEDTLLILIRYTALMHDSARAGEAEDIWEKDSGNNLLEVMKDLGIEKDLAEYFAKAIEFKNVPYKYVKFLSEKLNDELVSHFELIRIIINLADCLEIMRCAQTFNMEYMLQEFYNIAEYMQQSLPDGAEHPIIIIPEGIISLAEEVSKFISSESDSLVKNTILLPDGTSITVSEESNYNPSIKATYERAENIYSAIGNELRNHKFFGEYFVKYDFPFPQLAPRLSGLEPWIHGTDSRLLAVLRPTRFKMRSPVEMVISTGFAPLSGEINGGGLRSFKDCDPCFTELHRERSLNLAEKYTRIPNEIDPSKINEVISQLLQEIKKHQKMPKLQVLLIYLGRIRQLGYTLPDELNSEISNLLDSCISLCKLMELIGVSIFPNIEIWNMIKSPEVSSFGLMQEIQPLFKFENLLSFDYFINPTDDNLDILIDNLRFRGIPVLTRNKVKIEIEQYPRPTKEILLYLTGSRGFGDLIHALFITYSADCYRQMIESSHFLEAITCLEEFKETLNKLQKPFTHEYTEIEKEFIDSCFPLILVVEDSDSIFRLALLQSKEWRANRKLNFGEDIKIIATDTKEHQQQVSDFFNSYGIDMSVILIDELHACVGNPLSSRQLSIRCQADIDSRKLRQSEEEKRLEERPRITLVKTKRFAVLGIG